jgi:hypothetical protein
VPDQSQSYSKITPPSQQQPDTVNNPASMAGNDPAEATPESQASNVNRASEGQQAQVEQTIQGDPAVSTGDENAAGGGGGGGGDNYDDEEAWPYRALQQEAKHRELDASGKRDEIVARLRDSDGSGGASGASGASGDPSNPTTVDNGGIQQAARASEHAEILQANSDERRQQQLSAAKERNARSTDPGDDED